MRFVPLVLLTVIGGVVVSGAVSAKTRTLQYNRDVRPILSDKCFFCHGPDEKHREADLRLDVRASALAERDGVRAIVPGSLKKSDLVYRIETRDADDAMPPEKSHKTLSASEVDLLKEWVTQGAEYEDFWAYELRTEIPVPAAEKAWPAHNTIDRFIQHELREQGLQPSAEADRVTLIRRLTFDLIGLPPSADAVRAFVGDRGAGAYEAVVDRLLASPAYGERMAIMWLDLVRYADTVGFHGDQSISQSPYRDYVIDAFNSNMPYDRFTREQLAGDLLEGSTEAQRVASAYNRLNMTTEEGGAQPKEYLAKYASDRVRNVSAIWMGATVGCAECHDHKYDPYTAKDFYSFSAFFADIQEVGMYRKVHQPVLRILPVEKTEHLEVLGKEISGLEKSLALTNPDVQKRYDEWVAERKSEFRAEAEAAPKVDVEPVAKDIVWADDKPLRPVSELTGWALEKKGAAGGQVFSGGGSRRVSASGLKQHLFRVKNPHLATLGDLYYFMVWLDPKKLPKTVMLQVNVNGSWEHRAYWGSDAISYGKGQGDVPAYRHMGALPKAGEWVRLEVDAERLGIKPGAKIGGLAFTQFDGQVFWDQAGINSTAEGEPKGGFALQELRELMLKESPNKQEAGRLFKLFAASDTTGDEDRNLLKKKKGEHGKIEKSGVLVPITKAVKPRTVRVLPRGDWMDESGEVVQPAIPSFLGALDTGDRRATRLDLANWFVSDSNPLTARVFMNNLWGLYFGNAISRVQQDLGGQGAWPSHLDLLDWMAVDFRSNAWDVKRSVKQIVMSHTYRQVSTPQAKGAVVDPLNHTVHRQTPLLLSAELVRDNALSVSGLLVDTIGGPSVRPYQPAGYYRDLNFPKRTYKADMGEGQYRRGVYTWWQRTFLHPHMKAFDAPSREACTAGRPRSNTPLQALVLMNDPSMVEAARVFATRIIGEGGDGVDARIEWACAQALSKAPSQDMAGTLKKVYLAHKQHYDASVKDAETLVRIGNSKIGQDLSAPELAAWTSVSRVLFNLHEFNTRL